MKRKTSFLYRFLSLACLLIVWLVLLKPPAIQAQQPGGTQTPLPQRKFYAAGVSEYQLENGLKILLAPDRTQPQIILNTTYFVGSRQESTGQRGYAHLVEHLFGRSTPQHPHIDRELSAHGIADDYHTAYDFTRYQLSFTPRHDLPDVATLDWMLGLEADRMFNANLTPIDLEREKLIIRKELLNYESDNDKRLSYRVMAEAYAQHSYGFPNGGLWPDISAATVVGVRAFYHSYYRPDNAVVIIVGNFQEAQALRLIQKQFGSLPRPAVALPQTEAAEPLQQSSREVTLYGVGKTPLFAAGYHIPAQLHPDSAPLAVAGAWLSDVTRSSSNKNVLSYLLAQKFELREPGLMIFSSPVSPPYTRAETKKDLLRIIENATLKPSAEDVERIKAELLGKRPKTPRKLEDWSDELGMWSALGDWRYRLDYRERLEKVTVQDVIRVRNYYLRPINRTLGTFIPVDKPELVKIPKTKPKKKADLDRFLEEPKEDNAPQEIFDAAPHALEKQVQRGVTAGFRWALLRQSTRDQAVTAQLELALPETVSLTARHKISLRILAALLDNYNLSPAERAQFNVELEMAEKDGKLIITINTIRANLEKVLGMVMERLQTAEWVKFAIVQEGVLIDIDREEDDTFRLIERDTQRYLTEKPIFFGLYDSIAQDKRLVKEITAEEVRNVYQILRQEAIGVLAVAGDFDPQIIPPLLTRLGKEWKSQPRPLGVRAEESVAREVSSVRSERSLPVTGNTAFGAGLSLNMSKSDADYAALWAGDYMFGNGSLQSRVVGRLRETEGLAYSIRTRLDVPAKMRGGTFTFTLLCSPANIPYIEQAWQEEIRKVLQEGFTPAELESAKVALISRLHAKWSDNESLARHLAAATINGDTFENDALLESAIRNLTLEMVNAAFRRHIDPAKLSVFTINNTPPESDETDN